MLPRIDCKAISLRWRQRGASLVELVMFIVVIGAGLAGIIGVWQNTAQGSADPLIQKQADCISTMTYNEYWQVIEAGVKPEDLVVFKYEDQGVSTLEDGLYVMEDKLKDPKFVETMAKFVKASMQGWEYARANPAEAVKIVLDNDASGAQTEQHQTTMMQEVNLLTEGSDGTLDVAAAERTVETLMLGGSDPVITKKPEGAWSDAVTNAMK